MSEAMRNELEQEIEDIESALAHMDIGTALRKLEQLREQLDEMREA